VRLWSLHPRYLDSQGLVALWREALLAKAVLQGATRGYVRHPQLERFRLQPEPQIAICVYLQGVLAEAAARGFAFDGTKIGLPRDRSCPLIALSSGQLAFEWRHLLAKLAIRNPELHGKWRDLEVPECHPAFRVVPGTIEPWERVHG
jgi:hypothetical protein